MDKRVHEWYFGAPLTGAANKPNPNIIQQSKQIAKTIWNDAKKVVHEFERQTGKALLHLPGAPLPPPKK